MSVQKLRTFDEKALNGVLACKKFEKRDAVGSYYGLLAFQDVMEELQVTKMDEEEYKKTTAESSWS